MATSPRLQTYARAVGDRQDPPKPLEIIHRISKEGWAKTTWNREEGDIPEPRRIVLALFPWAWKSKYDYYPGKKTGPPSLGPLVRHGRIRAPSFVDKNGPKWNGTIQACRFAEHGCPCLRLTAKGHGANVQPSNYMEQKGGPTYAKNDRRQVRGGNFQGIRNDPRLLRPVHCPPHTGGTGNRGY